jgi:hypothetical protein
MTSIGKLPPMRGRDVSSKPHAGGHFVDLGQGADVTVEYYEYKPILSTWIERGTGKCPIPKERSDERPDRSPD